eukprot:8651430-Pyramimonas_sp.AAC.1
MGSLLLLVLLHPLSTYPSFLVILLFPSPSFPPSHPASQEVFAKLAQKREPEWHLSKEGPAWA